MFRNSLDHHVLKFLFVFFMYFICQKEKSATFPFLLVNHLSLVEVRLWKCSAAAIDTIKGEKVEIQLSH